MSQAPVSCGTLSLVFCMAKSVLCTPWVVGRDLWRSLGWPPARSCPVRAGCSGLCPAQFWVSLKTAMPPLLWALSSVWPYSWQVFVSVCLVGFSHVPAGVPCPSSYPCASLRRAWPCLLYTSHSVLVGSSKVFPGPSPSRADLTPLSLPFFVHPMLQHWLLRWPLVDSFLYVTTLVLGSLNWTWVSKRSYECRNHPLALLAALLITWQCWPPLLQGYAAGSWAICYFTRCLPTEVLCWQPVLLQGVIPPQMGGFALAVVELPEVFVNPFSSVLKSLWRAGLPSSM